MNNFLKLLDQGSAKILAPLKRFPLASFVAFVFILMMFLKMGFKLNHLSLNIYDGVMEKITFIAFFGFFLLLGLRLMTRNIIVPFLGLIGLVGFYFYLPESLKDFISHQQGDVIYPMVLGGVISFIIVAPFIMHKGSNRAFFEWLKAFVYAVLLSAFSTIFTFFILLISTKIIIELFGLGHRYGYEEYIAFFSFAFLAPYLFLNFLPKEPRALTVQPYNKAENIFFKYILTGLFIAYFIIIYVYLGKTIMLSEYPKGMVSVNIIAFSALGLMLYLFWTPLWNEKNAKYKKLIWIAILLQILLLAVALYLRVDAYGWTFGRLFLASLGIWIFALSLYALIKKEVSFRGIFLALPLIIVINLLFSSNISKHSQQAKLAYLLGSVETLSNDSNISLRYNISSTIDYLYEHHGTDALFPLLPNVVSEFEQQETEVVNNCAIPTNPNFPSFATEQLGFKYIDEWTWKRHTQVYNEPMRRKIFRSKMYSLNEGIELKGYDWIVNFNYHEKSKRFAVPLVCTPTTKSNSVPKYVVTTQRKKIIIKENKTVLASLNIKDFINKVIVLGQKNKNIDAYYNSDFTQEDFTYVYEDESVKVQLIFNSLDFTLKDELVDYGGIILIGKK